MSSIDITGIDPSLPESPFDLVLERELPAPPALAYRVWTDAAHLARWWGPHGFTNPVCRIDARPGGALYIVMQAPDGTQHPCIGTVLEAVPGQRLVWSIGADNSGGAWDLPTMPRNSVHIISFAPLDEGRRTRLEVRCRMKNAEDLAFMRSMGMAEGYGESLERQRDLAAALAAVEA